MKFYSNIKYFNFSILIDFNIDSKINKINKFHIETFDQNH